MWQRDAEDTVMAYKEGNCCKCDMPIVVQSYDWSESNNYCTNCAYAKMNYTPEEVANGARVPD
jgi:hypothetical protein